MYYHLLEQDMVNSYYELCTELNLSVIYKFRHEYKATRKTFKSIEIFFSRVNLIIFINLILFALTALHILGSGDIGFSG